MPTQKFPAMPELYDPACRRAPKEITEYTEEGGFLEAGEEPDDYVWTEEGTLDQSTGLFLCTDCYLKLGMPGPRDRITGPQGRWIATRENLQALGINL